MLYIACILTCRFSRSNEIVLIMQFNDKTIPMSAMYLVFYKNLYELKFHFTVYLTSIILFENNLLIHNPFFFFCNVSKTF